MKKAEVINIILCIISLSGVMAAVFTIFQEAMDLEPHADLRQEILRRSCQIALDDPRPRLPQDDMAAWLEQLAARPRVEPARWRRLSDG